MRRIGIALCLIIGVLLIGAAFTVYAGYGEFPSWMYQRWPQLQDSKTGVAFQLRYSTADRDMWNFITVAQKEWRYEKDRPGEPCQKPEVSSRRLKGDCDDFAVMGAYYLQDYWELDTHIIALDWTNEEGGHWVTFLWVTKDVKDSQANKCRGCYPYRTWQGRIYIPIDWDLCPDWEWVNEGPSNVKMWEWYQLVGKRI